MNTTKRQGVTVKAKRADHSDQRNQHERFVRDAIARSLLTLPFAHLDAEDPFGTIYGYYKQLLESATSGELPETQVLMSLVELICTDATIHEGAGNYLKADIERRWCEGLWLHFTYNESALLEQIADLKAELTRARELAEWFRADHTRTLPVVAHFRLWRMGHQDAPTFHTNLRGDSCGKALSLGPVIPMQAMAELNDWCARKEKP